MKHLPAKPSNLQPKPTTGGTSTKLSLVPKHAPQGGGAPGTGSMKK